MSGDREEKPIGDLLDSLGIVAAIELDALVSGAVVLLKTVQANGRVRLSVCHSEGLSWVELVGMVHLADAMETSQAVAGITRGDR